MTQRPVDRRSFLASTSAGMGTAWLMSLWPAIRETARLAHAARQAKQGFAFFQPEEAADVEAMTAHIIPADETPGAKEAGAVYFVDRALITFAKDQQDVYRQGLRQLTSDARRRRRSARRFSDLTPGEQLDVMRRIEKSEFFEQVRKHTVMGFLSNPEYGGNRNEIGWKLIGFEHAPAYQPPFGYYDRAYHDGR